MPSLIFLITSLGQGGAERVVAELDHHMSPGLSRTIVTLTNNQAYPVRSKVESFGLTFPEGRHFRSIYEAMIAIARYRRLLVNGKPDVSISFLLLDNLINTIACFGLAGVRTIVSIHTPLERKIGNHWFSPILKVLIRVLAKRVDTIIVVSNAIRDELVHHYRIDETKIKVLYNPIDLCAVRVKAHEMDWEDAFFDRPVIINVGGLKEAKGQWHLLRIFSEVRQAIDCSMVICGEGPLRGYLESLIADFQLERYVRLVGWTDNPYQYMARSSLFLMTSLWEALPYALIESMICGCPVISTDCNPGIREVIASSELGVIVPPLDGVHYSAQDPLTSAEEAIKQSVIELLTHQERLRALSENALVYVEKFDITNTIREYERLCLTRSG
jgi:glycosyltransferase involved in cell wall biosynthesis